LKPEQIENQSRPDYRLEELIDISLFQKLQDDLDIIYSCPSSIIDNEGNILTATAWQDVCTKFHRLHPECLKGCIKSDKYILDHIKEANPAVIYTCPHGLTDTAMPIIIGGQHLANFFTGQFFLEEPDPEFFKKQAKQYGFDEKAYLSAVSKAPVISKEKLALYHSLIKTFTEIIVRTGQKRLNEIKNIQVISESESKYRTLFESMPQGVFYQSANGHLIDVNPAALKMFGLTKDEFLGRTSYHVEWKVINEEGRLLKPEEHPSMITLLTGNPVKDMVFGVYNPVIKDYVWVNVNAHLKAGNYGNKSREVVVTMEDITERSKMLKKLKERDEQLRMAAIAVGFGIYSYEFETGKAIYSPEFMHLYGLSAGDSLELDSDLVGKPMHPDDKSRFLKAMQEANDPRGSGILDIDFRIILPDGNIRWLRSRGLTLFSGNKATDRPLQANGIIQDISESKKKEIELEESEEKFRTIFVSVGSGLVYMDSKGIILDVNPAFEEISGLKKEYLVGKNVLILASEILKGSEFTGLLKALYETIKGREINSFPFTYRSKSLSGSSFFNKEKNIIIVIVSDLTKQKTAEDQSLQILKRNKSILRAVPDILMEVNNKAVYTWSNEAGYEFFGKDVIGKSAAMYFEGNQDTLAMLQSLFDGKKNTIYLESWQRRKDGTLRLLAWKCQNLRDAEGQITGVISSARDITEIKEKEKELEESRERFEQLNLYLQRIREEERKLIARELHDDLGQALTAVKIDLRSLKSTLKNDNSSLNKIDKINSLVVDSIGTIKRITSDLRPHILDDLGLIPAIEWYTDEFKDRTKKKLSLSLEKNIDLPKEMEIVIFRILQESLTNIAKHSGAEKVTIEMKKAANHIILVIWDNGIGINPKEIKSAKSFGLLNMKERAREISGSLSIVSGPDIGTKISLLIPEGLLE
jgi:PAS domain S-box-containing protein